MRAHRRPTLVVSSADAAARRDVVCSLLRRAQLSVECTADDDDDDDSTLSVANGLVTITTPYAAENCHSRNATVLARVRQLISGAF